MLSIDRRRLFPKEAAASFPLHVRIFARTQGQLLSHKNLQHFIDVGIMPAKECPDAVNTVYAQGW